MPTPDLGPGSALARRRAAHRHAFLQRLTRFGRKRRDDDTGDAVPVTPNRPLDLSGGAAAALTFDD